MARKIIICKQCGKRKIHQGKGLCRYCYQLNYRKLHRKVNKVCSYCGKAFLAYDKRRKYCSPECGNKAKGERNKTGKEMKCAVCEKPIWVTPSQLKLGKKYCSLECQSEGRKKKIKKLCEVCKKEFYITPSVQKRGQGRFCSRKCLNDSRRGKVSEGGQSWYKKRSYSHQRNRIKINCKSCNKQMEIRISEYKQGRKYCSRECYYKSKKKMEDLIKICKNCGKKFQVDWHNGDHIFCNRNCYREYQQKKSTRTYTCKNCGKKVKFIGRKSHKNYYRYINGKKTIGKFCSKECADLYKTKPREIRICLNCKKEFEVLPTPSREGNDLLCSKKCQYEYYKREKHPNWLGGISFEPYGIEFNDELKEKIRERDGHICQMPGCNKRENGEAHSVHHINYNKKDNRPENLISLCRSCHQKTNFDRNYWQSYFTNKLNYFMEVDYGTDYQKTKAC